MNRKIILRSWEKHQKAAVPAYSFPAYVKDHRLSFYAGAGAVVSAIVGALTPNAEGEIDPKVIMDLGDELRDFIKEIEENFPKAKNAINN